MYRLYFCGKYPFAITKGEVPLQYLRVMWDRKNIDVQKPPLFETIISGKTRIEGRTRWAYQEFETEEEAWNHARENDMEYIMPVDELVRMYYKNFKLSNQFHTIVMAYINRENNKRRSTPSSLKENRTPWSSHQRIGKVPRRHNKS